MVLKIIRRGEIELTEDPEISNNEKINESYSSGIAYKKMRENKRKKMNPDKYDMNVQKMISYKGTIRPMILDVKNKGGGTYKLRVINIYVKPNMIKDIEDKKTHEVRRITQDNTRYYEEKVYDVNKGKIARGGSTDYYYPDKARWSKVNEKPQKTTTSTSSTDKGDIRRTTILPDTIELRRKRVKSIKTKRKSTLSKKRRTIKKR